MNKSTPSTKKRRINSGGQWLGSLCTMETQVNSSSVECGSSLSSVNEGHDTNHMGETGHSLLFDSTSNRIVLASDMQYDMETDDESIGIRLQKLTEDFFSSAASLEINKIRTEDLLQHVRILTAVVMKQSKSLSLLKSEVLDLKQRSMKDNILVHNLLEKDNEVPETLIKGVLREMGVDDKYLNFDRVHRVGAPRVKRGAKSPTPRPIVAKLCRFKDREYILQKTKKPHSQRVKGAVFVTPQIPEELRESRAKIGVLADAYRKKDANTNIKVKNSKLYVNNNHIYDHISPPTTQEVLSIDEETQKQLMKIKLADTKVVTEQGSMFSAKAVKVKSLNDVRQAYLKVASDPSLARQSHIIMAYKRGENFGYQDDGDFGLGRFTLGLLDEMKMSDIAVFIIRDFGGIHIGHKRFEIIADLVKGFSNL